MLMACIALMLIVFALTLAFAMWADQPVNYVIDETHPPYAREGEDCVCHFCDGVLDWHYDYTSNMVIYTTRDGMICPETGDYHFPVFVLKEEER